MWPSHVRRGVGQGQLDLLVGSDNEHLADGDGKASQVLLLLVQHVQQHRDLAATGPHHSTHHRHLTLASENTRGTHA